MQPLPTSLTRIRAYVDRAAELKGVDASLSYQLRLLAAEVGMRIAADVESKRWLLGLMDDLEYERKSVSAGCVSVQLGDDRDLK